MRDTLNDLTECTSINLPIIARLLIEINKVLSVHRTINVSAHTHTHTHTHTQIKNKFIILI